MDQVTLTVNVPSKVHVAFDEASSNFMQDPEYNRLFLVGVQNHMNQLLQIRGYVFVNEVLDYLGLPRTRDGQLLGWSGGGYVDFGLFDMPFGAGEPVGLSLNIDGVIVDSLT